MKYLKYILLVGHLLLMISQLHSEKRGLIIAVGDYPEMGGWADISSANDIPYVMGTLQKLGFPTSNILVLKDQQATKNGILQAFHQLHQQTLPGDFLYLHFSGHGQQVLDDNGDEVDRLDEAIVPFDSVLKFKEGSNEGQHLIRDDELRFWINKLSKKAGKNGQIILVLDACHSGTGTRGLGAYRGTEIIMAPSSFHLKSLNRKRDDLLEDVSMRNSNDAPVASFFGASPNQLNFETVDHQGKPVGSLSFAMSTVLSTMKRTYTYQELFDRVALKMKAIAPRQSPLWEGNGDLKILGGAAQNPLIVHNVLQVLGPQTITANIGSLHNVFEGTTVDILAMNNQIQATGVV